MEAACVEAFTAPDASGLINDVRLFQTAGNAGDRAAARA